MTGTKSTDSTLTQTSCLALDETLFDGDHDHPNNDTDNMEHKTIFESECCIKCTHFGHVCQSVCVISKLPLVHFYFSKTDVGLGKRKIQCVTYWRTWGSKL